jgi:O-succinylbenzoate synthase
VSAVQLFRYRLPLVAPLRSGERRLTVREGLLLRQPRQDVDTWGEAAPLPGFSAESLSQVIQAASKQQWDRYPCLQFAYASLSSPAAHGRLPLSALLMDGSDQLQQQIERASRLPHAAIKLKVARAAMLDEDIARVRTLRRCMRPDQRLRLDANRGWSYDQALTFARAVADCPLEYVEEPCDSPADFERLHAASGLPYALDETLREPVDLADFPHAAALIIKPTLMGSPQAWHSLHRRGIPLVFSATFESGVGLTNVARLAAMYSPDVPVGLDTYRWLASDVLTPRLLLDGGEFALDAAWQVEVNCLEAIPC